MIKIGEKASPEEIAHYTAYRTRTPLTVDGKLSEDVWHKVPKSPRFVDVIGGSPALYDTRSAVLWDEQNLYIAFWMEEPFVTANITQRDELIFLENDAEEVATPEDLTPLDMEGAGVTWELQEEEYYSETHAWRAAHGYEVVAMLISPEIDVIEGWRHFITYYLYADWQDTDGDDDGYLEDFFQILPGLTGFRNIVEPHDAHLLRQRELRLMHCFHCAKGATIAVCEQTRELKIPPQTFRHCVMRNPIRPAANTGPQCALDHFHIRDPLKFGLIQESLPPFPRRSRVRLSLQQRQQSF